MINQLNAAEDKFAQDHPVIYHLGGTIIFALFLTVFAACIVIFGGN